MPKPTLIVETLDPAALKRTAAKYGGVVGQDENGRHTVRENGGDLGFIWHAIQQLGHARVIERRA